MREARAEAPSVSKGASSCLPGWSTPSPHKVRCHIPKVAALALIPTLFLGTGAAQSNLLLNGAFNNPLTGTWTIWTTNGGWAGAAPDPDRSYNGTPYVQVGGSSGAGKVYQVVLATPNATYTLSCVSSVQNWWWPHGLMTLSFMDADNDDLLVTSLDCAASITNYDTGLPWVHYAFAAVSPPGTAKAKIQFSCTGSGTVFFDNAVLTSFTPTLLAAIQGTNAITLVWSASPSALSYNLKRSSIHGGPYVTIASGITTTNYADSEVAIGSTYYYVVSEVNASGEGSDSPEASALPANFLKANHCDLRDHGGTGEVVYPRGVNLGGWLYFEGWMCPGRFGTNSNVQQPDVETNLIARFGITTKNLLVDTFRSNWITAPDLDLVARAGMNLVRVPFHYSVFQEQPQDPSAPLAQVQWKSEAVAFKFLDWIVNECSKRRIYVVFDHHHPEGEPSDTGLYRYIGYQDRFVEIWRRIAARYAGNPTVLGYDMVNESGSAANLNNVWNRAYQTIRSVDPDHVIITEYYSISKTTQVADAYGWKNVVASTHDYWSEGEPVYTELMTARAAVPGLTVCPNFVGEFFSSSNGFPRMAYYSDARAPWALWTLKSVNQMNWSMINALDNGANSSTDVPDLLNDSAAVIAAKWARWTTRNPAVRYQNTCNRISSPIAVDDNFRVQTNGTLLITSQALLANDTDLSQLCQLTVTNLPTRTAHGNLTAVTNGFLYEQDSGFKSADSFTYYTLDRRLHLPSARPATVTLNSPLPLPPATVRAVPALGSVALSWSSAPDAAGYNLKRASVSGGPYATIAGNLTTTNFTDVIVSADGAPLYYVVTSSNHYGESGNSIEVVAAPVPFVLAAQITATNTLVLSWPADCSDCHLFVQSNPPGIDLSTNWVDNGPVASNPLVLTLQPGGNSVFYRLAIIADSDGNGL
jgi:endoglucanase